MWTACCLDELRRVRDANRDWIATLGGNLGTALGFKTVGGRFTSEPAVVFFVEGKPPAATVPASRAIPKTLFGPGGLSCATDVVVGRRSGRHNDTGVPPYGRVLHPDPARFRLSTGPRCSDFDSIEDYLDGVASEEEAYFRVDRAFVKLYSEVAAAVERGAGTISKGSSPAPPRLEGMGLLGREVVRTQAADLAGAGLAPRGTVAACDYEWSAGGNSLRTDYLIRWEAERPVFGRAAAGNLLVTGDGRRTPAATLWNGPFGVLRRGLGQDVWDYALDIDTVLGWQLEPVPSPHGSSEAMPSRAPAVPCHPVHGAPRASRTAA